MSETPDWLWIETDAQAEALWARIEGAPAIALDLEGDNFHAYNPRTCLLQLATTELMALIDPLTVSSEALWGLREALANPEIEVVMHGADNDLSALQFELEMPVRGLFDTQEAGRHLGLRKTGLGSLLSERFGVTMSKRFQRLDWSRRPLPSEALKYAAMDVRHLFELRDQLSDALEKVGLLEAVHQSCAWNARTPFEPSPFNPMGFRRIKGASDLTSRQRAVLKSLYLWRHATCDALNRAHLFVATDAALMMLARRSPEVLESLKGIRSLTKKQRERHGPALLTIIAQGLSAPTEPRRVPGAPPSSSTRPRRGEREVYDDLRRWRAKACERDGLPVDVVMPGRLLTEVIRREPGHRAALLAIPGFLSWRVKRYGDELLAAFKESLAK